MNRWGTIVSALLAAAVIYMARRLALRALTGTTGTWVGVFHPDDPTP